jgi:DNA polymerase-3 subunit epsilon
MGRCLSPCLGDLDPNLYRRRLDEVLGLFVADHPAGRAAGAPLIEHVEHQMRAAAARRHFERAASLRRRWRRLQVVLGRVGGVLEATHARPRLLAVRHPTGPALDGFWLAGGRLVDWGPLDDDLDQLEARTAAALNRAGRIGELGAHVPPDEIDEVRIVGAWLASHPKTPQLPLRPAPDRDAVVQFIAAAAAEPPAGRSNALGAGSALEGELDDDRLDLVGADGDR